MSRTGPYSDSAATIPAGGVTAKAVESKTLIPEYRSRLAAYVTNAGGKGVHLALGPTAENGKGPYLAPEGGQLTIREYSGEVSVIVAGEEGESLVTFAEV